MAFYFRQVRLFSRDLLLVFMGVVVFLRRPRFSQRIPRLFPLGGARNLR